FYLSRSVFLFLGFCLLSFVGGGATKYRSVAEGRSFAARQTTYRLYPNNELIPSKKNNGSERK
ncbi:hypothetical protein, partial [Parabacteroides johnsonii]|uniref:hypothetical protein n=1 Tax=Parabacteroides johnsonii TaxID=387661 RepID=UPI00242BDA11